MEVREAQQMGTWPKTKIVENQGVLHVQNIINECNCIFNKVDGSNDVGLDGYIEFTEKEDLTGLCVAIQIKSGDSNNSKTEGKAVIRADKKHFKFWLNHILPVIAVIYIPSDKQAYWIDVTAHLKKNDVIEHGPYTITVDKVNVFSVETFPSIKAYLEKYLTTLDSDLHFGKSLTLLADMYDQEERNSAVKSLFSYHRNKKETWFYLISLFRNEKNISVQRNLIYCFMHIIKEGDVWWHNGNIFEEDVKKYARKLITSWFSIHDLNKLIYQIEEDGICRGSLGYSIYFITSLIPDRIEWLKKIILDPATDDEKRFWSAVVLIETFQWFDTERAIHFATSMIDNFPNSEHIERLEGIRSSLREFSFVPFLGN